MNKCKQLAEALRKQRIRRKLTQEEVAIMTGISYNSYRKYETGKAAPNLITGLVILEALGVIDPYQTLQIPRTHWSFTKSFFYGSQLPA